jgi:predicted nucleic acid-binding protein
MTVYAETNYVLELALGQEQSDSCREILHLAESENLVLAIPAYSLMEPYEKLIRDAQRRQSLANELEQELSQLGRAEAFEAEVDAFEELAALLTRRREQELSRLRKTKDDLIRAGNVLPLSAPALEESLQLQRAFNLSPQDACVLAVVLHHLGAENPDARSPEPSCFVNRDASDFGDPDIEERLARHDCQIKYRFDDGLAFIQSHLS